MSGVRTGADRYSSMMLYRRPCNSALILNPRSLTRVHIALLRHVRRQWALLSFHSVCLSVCLDVCRSFRDLQPTTIDRSQPNLVGRYISVLGPKPLWIPYLPYFRWQEGKICKISPISNGSPLTRILATANVTHRTIWLVSSHLIASELNWTQQQTHSSPAQFMRRVMWTFL